MMHVRCECGGSQALPDGFAGELAECPDCRRMLRAVRGNGPAASGADGVGPAPEARLVIRKGPQRIGEQLILIGGAPIEIGKLPEKPIALPGNLVSRTHCRLVRTAAGWRVEDNRSTNGLFVNRTRVSARALEPGDVIHIGEYELEYRPANTETPDEGDSEAKGMINLDDVDDGMYDLAEEEVAPPPLRSSPLPPPMPVLSIEASAAKGAAPTICPSCGKSLSRNAKICIDCGIDVKTGRALVTARAVDEDALAVHTETTVRAISWLIPLGLYPVASEGFGTRKPHMIWATAGLTIVASVLFWIAMLSGGESQTKNLMLWCGREPNEHDILLAYEQAYPQGMRELDRKMDSVRGKVPEDQVVVAGYRQLPPDQQYFGEFHWWQLITHAFLHGGILHLAGNLLFLLVFGSRVNALIGPLKTAILYPILGIAAAVAFVIAEAHSRPTALVGASGAIMGLAGMYFVLFPVHRVHMVAWARLGLLTGFRVGFKIFALRGFWVVLFYLAFDVLATVLGSKDGVAHWAHLGGFLTGACVALILLLSRQVDARGGDLISVLFGRHAWALLGKPARRNQEPATAALTT